MKTVILARRNTLQQGFVIQHYAAKVEYRTDSWLDEIDWDLCRCCEKDLHEFLTLDTSV
jgi:hypothetical protein